MRLPVPLLLEGTTGLWVKHIDQMLRDYSSDRSNLKGCVHKTHLLSIFRFLSKEMVDQSFIPLCLVIKCLGKKHA